MNCHCRLNPLINYFIAGQAALAFVAQTVPRSQHHLDDVAATGCVDELLLTFRFVAHREIHAFCEVCQYSPVNAHAAGNGSRSVGRNDRDYTTGAPAASATKYWSSSASCDTGLSDTFNSSTNSDGKSR